MDKNMLSNLKRGDLQAMAKHNGVRATQKSDVIVAELLAHPSLRIPEIPGMKEKVGKDVMIRQKIMQRNGLAKTPSAPEVNHAKSGEGSRSEPKRTQSRRKNRAEGAKQEEQPPAAPKQGPAAEPTEVTKVAKPVEGAREGASSAPKRKSSRTQPKTKARKEPPPGRLGRVIVTLTTADEPRKEDTNTKKVKVARAAAKSNVPAPAQASTSSGRILLPAASKGNTTSVPKALTSGQQSVDPKDDEADILEEEEVEASLGDIVVDLDDEAEEENARPQGPPARNTRSANLKRGANAQLEESPRPAKRARGARAL